jgi:CRISPR/Cas system CMR-associated protein Cmr3 (group 5 of RAMP superfamily)
MNLPDFSKVEIPKRMASALAGAYLIKDVADLKLACIVAAIIVVGIVSQTITDLMGKKVTV